MNIISKMKQLKHLTPNEQTLVDFILKDVDAFLKLKRKDIASEAFVSVSTIYRLVDKLKLNGINEFKLQLLSSLRMNRSL
jgi:DNA-binding MurR/RpiR family transcriptional regulator